MKNELNLTYLVPKTLYHNLRQLLNGSQRQELDRANMTHWQEPQASALAATTTTSKQDTTADDTADTTMDTTMDTTILSPPRPTASSNPPVEAPAPSVAPPKPPVEPPKPPVEPPKPPVEPPKTPVKSPKPRDKPSPVKSPHASDLFGDAVRRGAYYDCRICGHTSHGKLKHMEHMLTHTSTPAAESVKPRKRSSPQKTPKKSSIRVETVKKQEEEQPESWTKFLRFTS